MSNNINIHDFVFWNLLVECIIRNYHNGHCYKLLDTFINKDNVRQFYEFFARVTNRPLPKGKMNEEYGINNIPYLLHSYFNEEDGEWEYRLYIVFKDKSAFDYIQSYNEDFENYNDILNYTNKYYKKYLS